MGNADTTLQSADHVLRSLEPGSTTRHELDKLLLELNQSASSVKQLADYLEQHPEALLRGKDDE